jgi:hypothetical protein
MQFNCFFEVSQGFLLGLALTGDVEFEALGDVPFTLPPDGSCEWSLHDLVISCGMPPFSLPQYPEFNFGQ